MLEYVATVCLHSLAMLCEALCIAMQKHQRVAPSQVKLRVAPLCRKTWRSALQTMQTSSKAHSVKSKATHARFNPKLLPAWQRATPLTREKRASLLQEAQERGKLMRTADKHWKRNQNRCLNKLLQLQKALDVKQEELYDKERKWLMDGSLKSPVRPANPAPWGFASPGIPRCFPKYCEKEDPAFPQEVKEEKEEETPAPSSSFSPRSRRRKRAQP